MNSEVEEALRCYERESGLRVTLHDRSQGLWRELDAERYRHIHPLCERVKASREGHLCEEFDALAPRREQFPWKQGACRRCPAGMSELVLPLREGGQLIAVLFAGPVMLEDTSLLQEDAYAGAQAPRPEGAQSLSEPELKQRLEQLRQLGARIRCWLRDHPSPYQEEDLPRKERIRRYLESHYAVSGLQIAELAQDLGLSPERSRHLIKELFGRSFRELLRDIRLQAASAMLANSDLPVQRVGERCGYPDPAGLHRAFLKGYGISPGEWRKRNRV